MMARCYRPHHPSFKHYGGRGIKVCKRWHSYENFVADMGEPPKNRSLDRVNNNRGYSKSNCKWATQREQCWNSRRTKLTKYKGHVLPKREWARKLGFAKSTIDSRLHYGWTMEQALSTPKHKRIRKSTEKFITFKGKTKYLTEWAKDLGINYRTLVARIRHKWPLEFALSKRKFRGGRYTKPIGIARNKK